MAFTAQDVAKLRETTGAGMMDCKKALTQTDGNMEKAAEFLREQGVSIAAKKASRVASEGIVNAFVSKDKKIGVLVEINCESDFVGKSEPFAELAQKVAQAAAEANPADNDALLQVKTAEGTVLELINNATAKIGEKISLRRFVRFENKDALMETYIHMGGKIGVLLEIKTGKDLSSNEEFVSTCHDITMHIAAISPRFIYENEVPAEEVERETGILKAQVLNEGKPAAVAEKIVAGRIKKFYEDICLIDQKFVKDPALTVAQVVESAAKKLGTEVKLIKFSKLIMGEGLEKKVDNLAEEVAKMQTK